jgi:hypothetical protein
MEMPAETRQLQRAMDGPKLLTASVDVLCYRVLILINQILGYVLQHELVSDGGHPSLDERSQIQQRLTVERKLVVNNLISSFLVDTLG